MDPEHFLMHLTKTNQLEKINHVNADGTPNMKYKYIRDLYQQYLYQKIPSFECSICMEKIENNSGCKLKCGHDLCIDCFANLARTSNKCALCRQQLSEETVKKDVDHNILIDVVNYELETSYTERNNMNLCEYIHDKVKKLIDDGNHREAMVARTVDDIVMEVFDSLHAVAYVTMETTTDQY
tara:strand:+ start:125 stop:670 length:546 start_codon:yes stop_codon:yes gene_type:complete